MQPVSLALNCAVVSMSRRLFPCGFDVVAQDAPETLEALTATVATGRMAVWSGASDDTIYGCPETNWAARAWHDWAHWRYQLPFTLAGEIAAAFVQVRHLAAFHGDEVETVDMAALILAEVIGQAEHLQRTGQFVTEQRAFTTRAAFAFQAMASDLVRRFALPSASDRAALALVRTYAAGHPMTA